MSSNAENAHRRGTYKNSGKDLSETRKKRAEESVELRKARKDDQLMKRRNMGNLDSSSDEISPLKERNINRDVPVMTLPQSINLMKSSDSRRQLEGVTGCRRALSKEDPSPISQVISAGALPRLVQFLGPEFDTGIQFEAAWALTNVASGDSSQTREVAKVGAVGPLVQLLSSDCPCVKEQAVWALSNLTGEGPDIRAIVVKAGVIPPLLALVGPEGGLPLLKTVVWALSNLVRSKPEPPPLNVVDQILPTLCLLLCHSDDQVLSDSCWAINHLADGLEAHIDRVIKSGVVTGLVALLRHSSQSVVTPALRAVGNIVTGTDVQTQCVVEVPGALLSMKALLSHHRPALQKEAAWALSNVAAGSPTQVQSLIDAGVIHEAVQLMRSADFKTAKEALWLVTNSTAGGDVNQVGHVVECGGLQALCGMLTIQESKLLVVAMEGIKNILEAAQKADPDALKKLVVLIEEVGGLDHLEALQGHENLDVYQQAYDLVATFFADEEEDEVDTVAPQEQGGTFQFDGEGARGAPLPGQGNIEF